MKDALGGSKKRKRVKEDLASAQGLLQQACLSEPLTLHSLNALQHAIHK